MQFITKHWRIFSVILFGAIYFAFFSFANYVINTDTETIGERDEEEVFEVKPADVDVTIDYGTNESTYNVDMQNTDSIIELLEELREGYGVSYEQVLKTSGIEILEIDGYRIDENSEWNVYDGGKLIVDYKEYKLDDNNHYYFKYEQK